MPSGKAAIGLAGDGRSAGGEVDDAQAFVAQHRGSIAPTMTSRLRGLVAVTTGENTDTATVAWTSGLACANRTTMSEAIECPSTASAAVASGQLARRCRDVGQFRQQCGGDGLALGNVAAHRKRVAAMAEKVEGHGDIAVARQRFRERLHQLLRSGKAMRDDDDRGGGAGRRPENRDRGFADGGSGDDQALARRVQLKQSDPAMRDDRDQSDAMSFIRSSPAMCFLRMRRTVHQIDSAATGTNAAVAMLGST